MKCIVGVLAHGLGGIFDLNGFRSYCVCKAYGLPKRSPDIAARESVLQSKRPHVEKEQQLQTSVVHFMNIYGSTQDLQ